MTSWFKVFICRSNRTFTSRYHATDKTEWGLPSLEALCDLAWVSEHIIHYYDNLQLCFMAAERKQLRRKLLFTLPKADIFRSMRRSSWDTKLSICSMAVYFKTSRGVRHQTQLWHNKHKLNVNTLTFSVHNSQIFLDSLTQHSQTCKRLSLIIYLLMCDFNKWCLTVASVLFDL